MLEPYWDYNAKLVRTPTGFGKLQSSAQGLLFHGGHHHYVLEHLVSLTFRGEAASLDRFKEVFGLVILRAKKKHFHYISVWLEQFV